VACTIPSSSASARRVSPRSASLARTRGRSGAQLARSPLSRLQRRALLAGSAPGAVEASSSSSCDSACRNTGMTRPGGATPINALNAVISTLATGSPSIVVASLFGWLTISP
jgi:hypothetical protein